MLAGSSSTCLPSVLWPPRRAAGPAENYTGSVLAYL